MGSRKLSGENAHSRIDTHERVCSERYGNINQQMMQTKEAINALSTQMHERLNTLSSRQWQGNIAVLGAAVVALGTILGFLILGKH